MAVVTTLFFMWGFLTCLNDILMPHLKAIFDLNYAQVMLVQLAFFTSYAVFAFPAGKLVEWIGYKRSMVVGLLIMAVGALCFIPAANVPSYPLFLGAEIVLAAGVTVLQVSGKSVRFSAWTGAYRFQPVESDAGLQFTGHDGRPLGRRCPDLERRSQRQSMRCGRCPLRPLQAYRLHEASTVKMPYLFIAVALVALAVAIALFKLPRIETTRDFRPAQGEKKDSILNYPHLLLGAVAIFLYVGAEVSIGSFLVNYFSHADIGNMTEQNAAKLVSLYWGGAMVGRFIGSAVLAKVRPNSRWESVRDRGLYAGFDLDP